MKVEITKAFAACGCVALLLGGIASLRAKEKPLLGEAPYFGGDKTLDRYSPLGFIPVAMWVGFATLLNFEILQMN